MNRTRLTEDEKQLQRMVEARDEWIARHPEGENYATALAAFADLNAGN